MSNLDKVRIGILGTGFGKTHAKIFSSFPDVEVMGIAGRNEQRTMEAARSLGIPGYTGPDALLNRADIDAVAICLPTKLHAQYAIAALTQGKDVFCETPIAYTMEDVAQMRITAKDNGKKLLVALFGRFVSVYKHVHDILHAGDLGKPKAVFANRRTPPVWGNGWNENFILDLMLHDVDYLYWLMGKPISVTDRERDAAAPAGPGGRRRPLHDRRGRGGHGRDRSGELRAKTSVELDEERKAAMVSNLLVVLCSEQETAAGGERRAPCTGRRRRRWRNGSPSCCGWIPHCSTPSRSGRRTSCAA